MESLFEFINHLEKYVDIFSRDAKQIVLLNEKLHSLKHVKNNKIINALLFNDDNYVLERQKKEILEHIKHKILDAYGEFEKVHGAWIIISQKFKKEKYKINLRAINKRKEMIKEYFNCLLEQLVFQEDYNYNDYVHKVKRVKKLVFSITSEVQLINNLNNSNVHSHPQVDYSSLKNLSKKDLREGDILILEKEDKVLNLYRKILKKMMASNFIHSAIIYEINEDGVYLFEANAYNFKKVSIDKLECEEGFTYILMRPKKPFKKKDLKKVKTLCEEYIGEKFNNAKIFSNYLERAFEFLFKNTFFYKRKSNPLRFLKGTFCSEIVARVYLAVGVPLGINEDSNVASPADIFMSKNLKKIGFFKKLYK